jgi:uncharacterized protein (TIGR00730 family)
MNRITVFGGSNPEPHDYEEALKLGRLLGAASFTVLTGGYIGTMEAVSRGAAETGGHVIGVTCAAIEAWRPVQPNQWVMEEMRFPTLRLRLLALIDECDAAIALPGGPGTLTEIATMWNHLMTDSIASRPLILIGPGWEATFRQFYQSFDHYIAQAHRHWLSFAPDVQNAFEQLQAHFS